MPLAVHPFRGSHRLVENDTSDEELVFKMYGILADRKLPPVCRS